MEGFNESGSNYLTQYLEIQMKSACVMLTKDAILGNVNTRLAKSIGHEKATRIHEILTEEVARTVTNSGIPLHVSFSGSLTSPLAQSLANIGARIFQQPEGDLGDKIHHAFEIAQRCVVIGSDCPWITSDLLNVALSKPEVVIGPAVDGGYYLIAATRPQKPIFQDISWSTESVFSETLQRCEQLKMPVHKLPMLYDIDTHGDLLRALNSNKLPPLLHSRLIPHA